MKNQYVLLVSIFGLLSLNHTILAMEVRVPLGERSDQTANYLLKYRTFTNEQLLNELNSLEKQLSTFMSAADFAIYMQQPDKLGFLIGQLADGVGDVMPPEMLYCVQKIIAVLSLVKYRALTGGQLLNELNNLELQLSGFISADQFADYMQAPDKIDYLYDRLIQLGETMPQAMRYCIQNIVAALLALRIRRHSITD